MARLNEYMRDGANEQARAVLAYLADFNIEESWDPEHKQYSAIIEVARWDNSREQGYVLSMVGQKGEGQLNIAFFEHRNSDAICAVRWEQRSFRTITIDNAEFGDVYKDKFDVSYDVNYGKVTKMAEWIEKELTTFWKKKK